MSTRNSRLRLAVAALAMAGLTGTAAAQVTLRIHHPLPPPSLSHQKFLTPWTQKVEAECQGKVKFTIMPAMSMGGTPAQLFDQARDGVADMIWTVLGYTPGRFLATEVFELPFTSRTAAGTSRALWEYVHENKLTETELKGVRPIVLHVHDAGHIHSNKPIHKLEDFRGLKLRGPTRLTTRMLGMFGATPVGMPITQVADSLSRGVIDGAIVPWEIIPPTRIHELVKFHTETPKDHRALYVATFIFAMNLAAYDRLPADVKKCIDNHSGAETSAWVGRVWDDSAPGFRKLAEQRGNQFHTVPAAELQRWEKAAAPLTDEWKKEVQGKGMDAEKLLKSARSLLEKHDRGN
ncbi:MAG TPA: TRAP transporter substrate-binding protein [Burkholderiaceae bacterium]|nr:TRAP transporter substrate-binding protein [Burkholderiaceae bacterium]